MNLLMKQIHFNILHRYKTYNNIAVKLLKVYIIFSSTSSL